MQAGEASTQQCLGASAQHLAQGLAEVAACASRGARQGEAALPGISKHHSAQATLLRDHTQVGGLGGTACYYYAAAGMAAYSAMHIMTTVCQVGFCNLHALLYVAVAALLIRGMWV
jgi:hypothetical protein